MLRHAQALKLPLLHVLVPLLPLSKLPWLLQPVSTAYPLGSCTPCFPSNLHQVTPERRTHAKHLCYGLLYGMGPSQLALELGVTPGVAMQLSESFLNSLPGVVAWRTQ